MLKLLFYVGMALGVFWVRMVRAGRVVKAERVLRAGNPRVKRAQLNTKSGG